MLKTKLKYLRYPFLKEEITRMGYRLNRGVIIKALVFLYGSVICISFFYQLKLSYAFFLIFMSTLSVPYHIYYTYKNQYQKKKYMDLLVYMEQMLYSFKRHPKILDALTDTSFVFAEGEMKRVILRAREMILAGKEKNLYQEALTLIEKEYNCRRIQTMHSFFTRVEQRGGRYKQTADLLLDDRHRWKKSLEMLEKEKQGKKRAIDFVLVSTFFICGIMISIFSALEGLHVVDSHIYQAVSVLFILGNLFLWLISSVKLSQIWVFSVITRREEAIAEEYKLLQEFNMKKARKLMYKLFILPVCFLLAGCILRKPLLIILGLFYFIYLLLRPGYRMKSARKRVVHELQIIFPQWLMELTLLLQTENVYVALAQSMEDAPMILKQEIRRLLEGIDESPNSLSPYHDFFYDLHIEDISTCMKILYSISAFDSQTDESPIHNLIQRNYIMMNKSEQTSGEDKLAVWTMVSYFPMAAGGIKIIMDMILLIASLVTSMTAI